MQIFDSEKHPPSFITLIEDGIERRALHSIKVVTIPPNSLTVKYYTMPDEDAVIKIIYPPQPTAKVKIALGSREELQGVLDEILKAVLTVTDSLTE